jgi:3-dehydroquinate synthase
VFEPMTIQSRSGPYRASFVPDLLNNISPLQQGAPFFVVDANIARLYAEPLAAVLAEPKTIIIEATEENKSIERIIPIIERLVKSKIRRGNLFVAIGGGIIQDITCFIASTLLRGIEWRFVPTTLLAQADSCIGSKSSINLGALKNILGTFNPPSQIWICPAFLDTLALKEVQSGVGEILKVHAIAGQEAFDKLNADFSRLILDRQVLLSYIRAALLIKRKFIEIDEYDQGIRNIFNYGHSFGHAIESATHFAIPHGVAVSIGMDMANHIAVKRGLLSDQHRDRMHVVLRRNYQDFKNIPIPSDLMLGALMKDKKNTETELILIFPVGDKAEIKRVGVLPDEVFRNQCKQFLEALQA